MIIRSIALTDFRSYKSASFEFSPGINIISGQNAAGKTNLLEAVYYLAGANSWRCRKETELINFDGHTSVIEANVFSAQRDMQMKAVISRNARRQLFTGGVKLSSPRELLGKLPCVLFAPEDLQLLRGGPSLRRRFMDMALCQLYPRYVKLLADYKRLQAGKLHMLKTGGENLLSAMPEYNLRMASISVEISKYRTSFINRIGKAAEETHRLCSCGEQLFVSYMTQVKLSAQNPVTELFEHMQNRLKIELIQKACLVGIHRDDIYAELDGKSVRGFASQGQTRTAAISMKLAERKLFSEEFGEPPLLLLDDVMSELDTSRQSFLLKAVCDGQVLITACTPEGLQAEEIGNNIVL